MANELKPAAVTPPAGPSKRTVWVQSVLRPAYGGSYRIGRFWTSLEATEAEVTDAELAELVACPLLHVFDQKPRKLSAPSPLPEATDAASVEAPKPAKR
jgi:hypothetical protein